MCFGLKGSIATRTPGVSVMVLSKTWKPLSLVIACAKWRRRVDLNFRAGREKCHIVALLTVR